MYTKQFRKFAMQIENVKEADYNTKKDKTESSVEKNTNEQEDKRNHTYKTLLKCEACDFTSKNEISLKKHINTKHVEHKCEKCPAQFQTSIELLKHRAEHQESDKGGKFNCDECSCRYTNKKNLKKHMIKSHNLENPPKNAVIPETELNCSCTEETVYTS